MINKAVDTPSANSERRFRFEFDRASDDGMPVPTVHFDHELIVHELLEIVSRHPRRAHTDRLDMSQSANLVPDP